MIKRLWLILLVTSIILSGVFITQAAPLQQNAPQLTAFTSTSTSVDRAALVNRTARVPVAWSSANRPNTANLVFEQVLPSGQAVNVELPRQNAYVPSAGNGVVAPLSPGEGVNEIRLRVTLLDVINPKNYDQREIVLPITAAPAPVIRIFSTNASNVNRSELNNSTARIPVSWTVDNRPEGSNLVFEQVLDNNTSVNVELPRSNPFVTSAGNGVVAPRPPGGSGTTIVLRLRLINLVDNATLVQKDISLPIVENTTSQPLIAIFSTSAATVSRVSLTNKTARIPVAWSVYNRPEGSNLVFEQVLDNGSVVNVELPRQNPFVSSDGNGVVAPVVPGTSNIVKLQVRLINLTTQVELAKRDLTVTIDESSATPSIRTFTTSATSVSTAGLANKTERVPVSWQVDNRPANTNLVFEQVLSDGSAINVELPRNNPIVPSAGSGTAAPTTPGGGNANSITLRLRLIDLSTQATLDQKTVSVPITVSAAPVIATFTTTAANVSPAALANKTARIPVIFAVTNRTDGTNLVFEQILSDNSVVNVELPRNNPIVPSSGTGVVAPVAPGGNATSIMLRLRVINLATQATLVEQNLPLSISDVVLTPVIRTFTTSALTVSRAELVAKTARVPVTFAVDSRADNTNLVFEQVLDNGSVVNVELPRTVPIVPSSGNGVVAPVAPANAATTSITIRLRVIDLGNQATLAQQTFNLNISEGAPGAGIRSFTSSASGVDFAGLANRTARVPVSWQVDNRPANSNLVFEQVLPDGNVVNVELPRQNPIVPSSGSGTAAAVAPGGQVMPGNIILRLRLVNLANNTTLGQSDINIVITGQTTPFVLNVDPTQCYSNGFAAGNGLIVGGRGKVSAQISASGLPVYSAGRNGTLLGNLQPNATFTITEGPFCFRYTYASAWTQLYWRIWKVKAETGALEGWAAEYENLPTGSTRINLEAQGAATIPNTGNNTPPQITTFSASPNPVGRGGTVTFNWDVTGTAAKVTISRISVGDGANVAVLDQQPAKGTGTFALPADYINEVTFTLRVVDSAGQETQQTVTIPVSCPFSSSLSEDCPVTQATNVTSAYQNFEQGQMVWRGDLKKIYVLYNDGNWAEFDDTWTDADGATPGDAAPSGLFKPEHGFGKVWMQVGGQAVLGWATTAESSYTSTWETHELADGGAVAYTPHFTLPNGTVVHTGLVWTTG